jgi:hypothetical protein
MDNESDMEKLEKLILKQEKRKEMQKGYDAIKYQKIKEKRLEDNKKYYQEITKPKLLAEKKLMQELKEKYPDKFNELIKLVKNG